MITFVTEQEDLPPWRDKLYESRGSRTVLWERGGEIPLRDSIAESFKNVADDYTEFNGDYSTCIDGKPVSMNLAEPAGKAPGRRVAAEMLNPKVQVYGDAAILTYNFAGINKNKDGELKPFRAKSTRVYVKQGGKWKMVHANFAPDPKPEN